MTTSGPHELPYGWGWLLQPEVFSYEGGSQPPASEFTEEKRDGYVRLIQIRDYYTDNHVTYIPDSSRLKKCTAEDVMIARYGSSDNSSANSLGRICRGLDGAYNVALAKTIPSPCIRREYLYYLLQSAYFQYPMKGSSSRSVQAGFNKATLASIQLPIPPLPEQEAIAKMLGALDDKIELNRKMNATLDELARTIFRSWFVDFDPVHAKAEGRAPFGMDAETAALFPDRFTDSELGSIPQGWRLSTIGKEVEVVGGSTPGTKNPEFWEGGTNLWVTPKDLSGVESPVLIDSIRKITDAGVGQISSRQLPVGTVLLSSRAPVGYLALTTEPTSINQGFIAMVCNHALPNYYILNWARESMDTIKNNAGGTTFAEISKTAFRPIKVMVPDARVLEAFIGIAAPIYAMIEHNLRESRTLVELRDTLLPELISGRIRVPEAEKLVGEMV